MITSDLSVKELLDITGGILISGRPELSFAGITIDSRKVTEGDLFIAIPGKRYDGHDFVGEAAKNGARGIVVQRNVPVELGNTLVIAVPDTVAALGDIARAFRARFTGTVIAITGSSGKTTTKEMVAAVLERRWHVHKTQGNLNNLIGVPLTIFGLKKEHEVLVLELGTNQPGEISRLGWIVKPNIACVTNIGPAHLEGLGSIEGVAKEKTALFDCIAESGTAIINVDDPILRDKGKKLCGRKITFGLNPAADVTIQGEIKTGKEGAIFDLRINGKSKRVTLPLPGKHNVMNALAASAISMSAGASLDDIATGLESLKAVSGRMEIIILRDGIVLINDVYNANPASCEAALEFLFSSKGRGKSFVILGDMLELGEEGEERHKILGEKLVDTGVEKAYLKGNLVKFTAQGAREKGWTAGKVAFFDEVENLLMDLGSLLSPGDWILVKGSRGMKMEEVVEGILRRFGQDAGGEA